MPRLWSKLDTDFTPSTLTCDILPQEIQILSRGRRATTCQAWSFLKLHVYTKTHRAIIFSCGQLLEVGLSISTPCLVQAKRSSNALGHFARRLHDVGLISPSLYVRGFSKRYYRSRPLVCDVFDDARMCVAVLDFSTNAELGHIPY